MSTLVIQRWSKLLVQCDVKVEEFAIGKELLYTMNGCIARLAVQVGCV